MATCSPLVAAGPLADLGYQEEVCYGRLPENPALLTFRRRSTTLTLTKEAYDSEEVRSDRMVSDSRHGVRSAGGDIVAEISPGSHGDAYQALLGGVWTFGIKLDIGTTNVTTSLGTGANAGLLMVSAGAGNSFYDAGFRLGDGVGFTGTSNADLDYDAVTGEPQFTVVDINVGAGDGSMMALLPTTPGFDLAGLTVGAITAGTLAVYGSRLEMGNIYRSFVFERAFSDIGSFIRYSGCRFNSAAFDLPASGIATVTFNIIGKDASPISSASFDGVDELVIDQSTLTSLTFANVVGTNRNRRTITAAAGDFTSSGINPGDVILIDGPALDGMPQNKNPFTVVSIDSATQISVAEAVQPGATTAAADFTLTRVGLPDYQKPDTISDANTDVMVAATGRLLLDGEAVGVVTALSFTIDNQMAGSQVVGENVLPNVLWGNQCIVSGNLTVLFDRGGPGEKVYNAFDLERDMSLILMLKSADGTQTMRFSMPRIKINGGSIGDAVAEGLPVETEFRALKPQSHAHGEPDSQIVLYDTDVSPTKVIP